MSKKDDRNFHPIFTGQVFVFQMTPGKTALENNAYLPTISQINSIMKFLQELKDNPNIIEKHNKAQNDYLKELIGPDPWDQLEKEEKKEESERGFVYLIECGGLHKIGITKKNPEKRLKAYTTANPFDKTLLFCKKILNYKEVEDKIKTKFQHKLKKGHEWFKFSEKDIRRILNYLEKRSSK